MLRKTIQLFVVALFLIGLFGGTQKAVGESKNIASFEDLNKENIKIGVQTGTTMDIKVNEFFPNAEVVYFNSYPDMAFQLASGGIDSFAGAEPVVMQMEKSIPEITHLGSYLEQTDMAFVFPKTAEGKALSEDMSEFIDQLEAEGTLDSIFRAWITEDLNAQVTDLQSLTGENGTLDLALESAYDPFCFIRDGQPVGIDMDVIIRYCQDRGYKLVLHDMVFDAVIPSLGTLADFGTSGIEITEEREEEVYFSSPYYSGGNVMVVAKKNLAEGTRKDIAELEDLKRSGVIFGVRTGTVFDTVTEQYFPNAERLYFNDRVDLIQALKDQKIDAFIDDEPVGMGFETDMEDVTYLREHILKDDYAVIFPKDGERAELKKQVDEFINSMWEDGSMGEMVSRWTSNDPEQMNIPDLGSLTGENGALVLAGPPTEFPFLFLEDGEFSGLLTELFFRFGEKYGYKIDIRGMEVGALVPAIASGKSDIGIGCISITEERKQQVDFSVPFYHGGMVAVVRAVDQMESKTNPFISIKDSFEKTFIRESRWKLILQGIGTTVLISVCAAIIGTILGFGICMMKRSPNPLPRGIASAYVRILQGTPMVVLLMILFYIVFAKSELPGVFVAIIGFALNFAAYVSEMMRTGIESVDNGQMEAALALGYTKTQGFFRIVMPQAARNFLPVYNGELVSLVKSTSVVGYIAVQDLTKMSDIIRSRTYEAFFPLIATAIIYFMIAGVLSWLLKLVQKRIEPDRQHRTVKGVELE